MLILLFLCLQLSHCDEQLQIEDKTGLTPLSSITAGMRDAGQTLLNQYVHTQGAAISQVSKILIIAESAHVG